jgi:hypothetical protein
LRRERVVTLLLAIAAALPVVAIAVWSIRQTAIELADPCATWDQAANEQGALSVSISPQDPCKVKAVHSQSKAHTAILAAVVPGGLLATTLLAVAGAAFSRRRVILAGAIGILAETIVVFTIAPLTLIVGVSFLFLSRRVAHVP